MRRILGATSAQPSYALTEAHTRDGNCWRLSPFLGFPNDEGALVGTAPSEMLGPPQHVRKAPAGPLGLLRREKWSSNGYTWDRLRERVAKGQLRAGRLWNSLEVSREARFVVTREAFYGVVHPCVKFLQDLDYSFGIPWVNCSSRFYKLAWAAQ